MTGDKALPSEWSKRLVEALVASGELELATARSALERSSATGAPVALLLVQTGVIGGDAALECLSSLSGMDHVDL